MANSNENPAPDTSKIDAIKELIFGPDIDSINQRFTDLEARVGDNMGDMNTSLSQTIKNLEASLLEKLAKSEEKANLMMQKLKEDKTDREKLGNLLIKLGENLKK